MPQSASSLGKLAAASSTLLLALFCFHETSSFTSDRIRRGFQSSQHHVLSTQTHAISHPASILSVAALSTSERDGSSSDSFREGQDNSLSQAQTDRFHQDMKRVLESRANGGGLSEMAQNSISERRQKPEVLNDDKDGVGRVLTMLDRMIEMGLATEETFQIAMRACLQRGRLRWKNNRDIPGLSSVICAADQLEYRLSQLQAMTSSISLETYLLVLEAYAVCSTPRGGRNYAKRADSLLRRMKEEGVFGAEGVESLGQDDPVSVEALTHVVHAWAWQQANRQPGGCATNAHNYLEQIESLQEDVHPEVLLQCYDWVLEAWSKSGSPGSNKKADQLFAQMKELNQTQTESTILNAQSYSNAILAWSKSREPKAAQRAHDLLVEMLEHFQKGSLGSSEPELIAFNAVISAWTKAGKPEKAREVIKLMTGIQPQCTSLVPDVQTYNSVLHAHVMSPDKKKALGQIRSMVEYMETNCEEQPALTPDSFTYNTLMKAWIRSGEDGFAEQSEKILRKMEILWNQGDNKVEPTSRHFNVVINAYAKSSDPFAGKKAYALLQRMKGGSFRSKPDIISYTSVIESFSKSADTNAAHIVIELLEEAFTIHEETGDPAMRPNLRTFTMVILTLSNCNGSIEKARELLSRMVKLYEETKDEALRPNAYPYNYVLNCAANTVTNKMQAFRLATQTYQEMRESPYVAPDSYTYAFWFKCCNNLVDDNELKGKCLFYAFDECRKEGLVTDTVLNRLQRGTSPKVLEEWLGIPKRKTGFRDLKTDVLPPEWSRNAYAKR